jgi:hypothetical protein
MTKSRKVEVVARILRARFPTMTDKDVVNLAFRIVEALENEQLPPRTINGNNH